MKLTTILHLVPRSRIRGAIPPLPNMPSRRGTQLKKHKGKGKVVPVLLTDHHAMTAYWGSGDIAPLIL
jgi:hypothetical protein